MSAVIDHTMHARLITQPPAGRVFSAALRYDGADPLAVRVVFPAETSLDGAEVTWTFARELLDAGLREPTGQGDVHIWPCGPGRAVIELHSAEGVAVLEFRSSDLRRFLLRSYEIVPVDQEHQRLDVDGGLTALLRGV